jgi:sporulation protein YlmC with PRC-barrel domain
MIQKIVLFVLCVSLVGASELSQLDAFRSKLLTSAVAFYFNAKGYGKVENITVDTTKRNLNFLLLPEGETQKLSVMIGQYQIKTMDKEEVLVLQNVQTNRVWLNRIFADHMKEGIKIPLGNVSKGAGALFLNL